MRNKPLGKTELENSIIESIAKDHYYQPGESSLDEVFIRVSQAIGKDDKEKALFLKLLRSRTFLPNSPTLMNAGTENQQLSACFVLPVEDSIEGIFNSVRDAALIHKTGGGTGFSFGKLRPKGSKVQSTQGVASGPVSFMRVFNSATEAIKQGGKRRGANMGSLPVWHPDIMEFIHCKEVEGGSTDIPNFNISIMLDDSFMHAVVENTDYSLYSLNNEGYKEVYRALPARSIFNQIVQCMWLNGEPGVLFYDTINTANTCPGLGSIETTNPCGEQPLLPYGSCNLGSIDVSKFVFTTPEGEKFIAWEELDDVIHLAVKFLDRVVDCNKYPLPQIKEISLKTRNIGLGLMGFADLLFSLGIRYGSPESFELGEKLMEFINTHAIDESEFLADEEGIFPAWEGSLWEQPMRNSALTTVAPTGTIALLAGCSHAIEPAFSLVYNRRKLNSKGEPEIFRMINPYFEESLNKVVHENYQKNNPYQVLVNRGKKSTYSTIDTPEEALEVIKEEVFNHLSCQHITWLPPEFREIYVTAGDINYMDHLNMQSSFQKHCHSAISKTINLPENTSPEEIGKAIITAWEKGLKGFTCYRDNSRKEAVLTGGISSEKVEFPEERPKVLPAWVYEMTSGCGKLYVVVAHYKKLPYEVFIETDGTGGCAANSNGLGRAISAGLRGEIEAETYVKQFSRVKCDKAMKAQEHGLAEGKSCSDIVGKCINDSIFRNTLIDLQDNPNILSKHLVKTYNSEKTSQKDPITQEEIDQYNLCPNCAKHGIKTILVRSEGCFICPECGEGLCN